MTDYDLLEAFLYVMSPARANAYPSISLASMRDVPKICIGVITLPKYKQLDVINKISYTSALSLLGTYLEDTR